MTVMSNASNWLTDGVLWNGIEHSTVYPYDVRWNANCLPEYQLEALEPELANALVEALEPVSPVNRYWNASALLS